MTFSSLRSRVGSLPTAIFQTFKHANCLNWTSRDIVTDLSVGAKLVHTRLVWQQLWLKIRFMFEVQIYVSFIIRPISLVHSYSRHLWFCTSKLLLRKTDLNPIFRYTCLAVIQISNTSTLDQMFEIKRASIFETIGDTCTRYNMIRIIVAKTMFS